MRSFKLVSFFDVGGVEDIWFDGFLLGIRRNISTASFSSRVSLIVHLLPLRLK